MPANPQPKSFKSSRQQPWKILYKGKDAESLRCALLHHLEYSLGEDQYTAKQHDIFLALAMVVRDLLMERWLQTKQTYHTEKPKRVYYLSMEYLIGRLLGDSLLSLDINEPVRKILNSLGYDLDKLFDEESEAGLGNGGLGRLAACFLDSLATLQLPAVGYGIRYEYGLFEQKIVDGSQVEEPDRWLNRGDPWEIMRPKHGFKVQFYGRTERGRGPGGAEKVRWIDTHRISALPYDILIPGFRNNTVNTLRLWSAHATEEFDLQFFNDGNYPKAWERIVIAENISKVLYPRDDNIQGKELRLRQEYFFTSASLQDIMRRHQALHGTYDNLADKAAIQLNDTHPAIGIPEMMRLLVDENDYPWDKAWAITEEVFAYTNHTLLSEALEKWPVELLGRVLPRHLEIIYIINERFLKKVSEAFPNDMDRLRRMSIIEEDSGRNVRMAHLAIIGSHMTNGVARIHSNLLKTRNFKDFYDILPRRFTSKTNGITQRRWLLKANPDLSALISERIGSDWISDLHQLRELVPIANDASFQQRWRAVKTVNKEKLAAIVLERNGIKVDPASIFDCQVKRFHEYKRQQMNILGVIARYLDLKSGRAKNAVPRTIFFGGKAAPGYYMAKLIIRLINGVAEVVNRDPAVADLLKVVFLENYNVSLGERVFAAADLSEQISTAGMEASGTGNMKFCLNGALTIGTMDGANIEIGEEVGWENIFIFGLKAEEVENLRQRGYNPKNHIRQGSAVDQALAMIEGGAFSRGNRELFRPFVDDLRNKDRYMCLADFDSYASSQERVSESFRNTAHWTAMSIINVAKSGKFSSDRTIRDYAQEIWRVKPVPIEF